MRAIRRSAITGLVGALIWSPARTQQVATVPIDSGTLVRMDLSRTESLRGRLLRKFSPSDTTLTFCRYPATPCASMAGPHVQTLPAAQVTRLEVAQGTHWIEGASLGALIAGTVAALFISTVGQLCEEDCGAWNRKFALGTVALGIGVGLAFGSQSVGWRRVP